MQYLKGSNDEILVLSSEYVVRMQQYLHGILKPDDRGWYIPGTNEPIFNDGSIYKDGKGEVIDFEKLLTDNSFPPIDIYLDDMSLYMSALVLQRIRRILKLGTGTHFNKYAKTLVHLFIISYINVLCGGADTFKTDAAYCIMPQYAESDVLDKVIIILDDLSMAIANFVGNKKHNIYGVSVEPDKIVIVRGEDRRIVEWESYNDPDLTTEEKAVAHLKAARDMLQSLRTKHTVTVNLVTRAINALRDYEDK